MNHAEWIRRYNTIMDNSWTGSVTRAPDREEMDCAMRYAAEIRQGLAAGLLGQPLATHSGDGPTGDGDADLAAAAYVCGCGIRPTPHIHPADERDEPNGEQADPIITQPLTFGHIAEQLADDIRAAGQQFVPDCRCPGCTTARKINARVAERDALT